MCSHFASTFAARVYLLSGGLLALATARAQVAARGRGRGGGARSGGTVRWRRTWPFADHEKGRTNPKMDVWTSFAAEPDKHLCRIFAAVKTL